MAQYMTILYCLEVSCFVLLCFSFLRSLIQSQVINPGNILPDTVRLKIYVMKKLIYMLGAALCLFTTMTARAQKYKVPADTVKLNKEYLQVTTEIASLTEKLGKAQNELATFQNKASSAEHSADKSAEKSSDRADQATGGSVKDAKKAKRSAKSAYKNAKDSQSADSNLSGHEKKIAKLSAELKRKQQRLEELNVMHTAIYNQLPT